ncbi:MAG: DNA-binding protein WhiA [Clostridia bacterium]|nr:DNA-binding protein WhiA [Clostridia bacterium]
MSFASEVKNELARIEPEKTCCRLAEISGFLRVAGSIRLLGGGRFRIVAATDNPAITRHIKRLLKEYFKIDASLSVTEPENRNLSRGKYRYLLNIEPEQMSEEILRETGILMLRQGRNYISDGIYDDIIRSKCCRKAYLKGAFLGAGTMSDPARSYHLEITCNSRQLANDLRKLINTFVDLNARTLERKGRYAVYMKNSAYIRDTLAIMGAHAHVLEFDEVLIRKQMKNDAVRMTNCDSANTDRALDASQKQVEAIRVLRDRGEFESLPEKLQEIARLRLDNPEASLIQLGEMLDPPLKKSGVNNRLKKLLSLAGVK